MKWSSMRFLKEIYISSLLSILDYSSSFSCFFKHQVELPTRGYSNPTLGALVYSAAPETPERHAFSLQRRAFSYSAALLVTAPRF